MNSPALTYLAFEDSLILHALSEWKRTHPNTGVMALMPEAEKHRLPALQAICRDLDLPLVGGLFPALLTPDGFQRQGLGLVRLDRMPPYFLLDELQGDAVEAANRIVSAAEPLIARNVPGLPRADMQTLFLMCDALLPHIASMFDAVYLQLANLVEYAGVSAGSDSFQPMACLFDRERLVQNGVLGLLLPDTRTVLQHRYGVPDHVITATSTQGNRIVSLNWGPAFDAYCTVIKSEYGVDLTRENFYTYACHFPFGMLLASGDVVVRIPVAVNDDGSLLCVGEVPENSLLVLLRAPGASEGQCVKQLVDDLASMPGRPRSADLLTFYCAGRHMHMGVGAELELKQLVQASGATRILGAESLGEIGSTRIGGYPLFHNAALLCVS